MILAMSASPRPWRRSRAVIRGRAVMSSMPITPRRRPSRRRADMVDPHDLDRGAGCAEQLEIGGRIGARRVERGPIAQQLPALVRAEAGQASWRSLIALRSGELSCWTRKMLLMNMTPPARASRRIRASSRLRGWLDRPWTGMKDDRRPAEHLIEGRVRAWLASIAPGRFISATHWRPSGAEPCQLDWPLALSES